MVVPVSKPEPVKEAQPVVVEQPKPVAKQKQIDMPIVEEIYRVLYEDKKPQQSARDLMLRDLKHEMK